MPQPLSFVKPDAKLSQNLTLLEDHGELTALVLRVIAHWSVIDARWGIIWSDLSEINSIRGSALYYAIRSPTAQDALMETALQATAHKAAVPFVRAVRKVNSGSNRRRNEFAHHHWLTSEDIPDALILIDRRVFVEHVIQNLERSVGMSTEEMRNELTQLERKRTFVYRRADLEECAREAARCEWRMAALTDYLRHSAVEYYNAAEAGRARQALLSDPRIAESLQTQSKDQNR